jgi:hypothetical protein
MSAASPSRLPRPAVGCCTRRGFLRSALLTLMAGTTASSRLALADSGTESCVEPPWLANIIYDRTSAQRLGQAYLNAHPQYRRCDLLIADIQRALEKLEAAISSTAPISEALQRLVRAEYAGDQVVSVSGWIVSRTEARLYALAALTQ